MSPALSRRHANHYRQAGFTLIEAIMVIVITGILAGIVAVFITKPVQGYVDAVRRAELTDAADEAFRRITRDIRLALPNSLRVGSAGGMNYIEFILTSTGGRYRDASDGSTGGNIVDFTGAYTNPGCSLNKCFDRLGAIPTTADITAGDYIVVYNQGPGSKPADAYNYDAGTDACRSGGCNIAKVSATPTTSLVNLTSNPFVGTLGSPSNSFQVVPGNTKAVTYACATTAPANLSRYSNYGFNTSLATPPSGTPTLLASNVTCQVAPFTAGILSLTLTLSDSSGESVTLFQQIHVDNAP